jgi:hypothetical protein
MKTKLRNSICGLLPIALTLICFGLAPMVQAVGPDTDGSIPGSNNGEGIGVLVSRTTGIWNTGTGFEALNQLTAGNQNTATGLRALFSDTSGGFNTATGVYSLFGNTIGFFNSATGAYSLAHNTDGTSNTANGYSALYSNTEGEQNTATGSAALYRNTTGIRNTANGYSALYFNTTGVDNTVTGTAAAYHNTVGEANTAIGFSALFSNTDSDFNTAIGHNALVNTTGGNNTAVGFAAGFNQTSGSNNIYIGDAGVEGESNVIAIGAAASGGTPYAFTYIGGIYDSLVNDRPVYVRNDGALGTLVSSRRYKEQIEPMDKASEALFALKPVTFRYRQDRSHKLSFGLIAEDVAEISIDLVSRDKDGKPQTVRYEAVNAMLLNEFLKEHKKVEAQNRRIQEQETTITQLKKEMETVVARLKEQDSKIQAVSDQVELSKPARQMVNNDQR